MSVGEYVYMENINFCFEPRLDIDNSLAPHMRLHFSFGTATPETTFWCDELCILKTG